jgi:hypothetical protein
MRYYDGELSEEEAAELERTLDGQSARVVAGLDQLGSVLRAVSERRSEAAGDIAGSVLERIAADEAQPAPAAVAIRPAARWVAPAAVAALALAASVALYLGSGQEPPSPVARTASRATLPAEPVAPVVAPPQPEAPTAEEEDVPPAVAIEAVDFGSHNGAIFMVSAGAEAEATPVVWLTDDAAPRTEPL